MGCSTGIFSTTNDGETWQRIFPASYISEFYIFEENGNTVIYAITGRTRVLEQGNDPLGDNKLYRFNFDGSGLLESFQISDEVKGNSFDIETNPNNFSEMWISTDHGVFYSNDSGSSFENKTGDLPDGNITSMISNPNNFEDKIVTNYTEGVFRRIGGFNIWTNITSNIEDRNQFSSVFCDPNNNQWGQNIFVAQADGNLNTGLWHTTNSGESWVSKINLDNSLMGWATGNKIASHAKGVFINANNQLIMGRSGNIFKCTNPQETDCSWEQIYTNDLGNGQFANRGLANTVVRDVTANPANTDEMWIAEGDRLLWKSDNGGESYKKIENFTLSTDIYLQHGYFVVYNPVNSDIMLAGLAEASPGGTMTSALFRSLNGGESWTQIYTWQNSEFVKLVYNTEGNEIYVGLRGENAGIYKSATGGSSWQFIDWGTNNVYDLNTHPTNQNILFVGIGDPGPPTRGLHRGVKSGGNWEFTRVLNAGLNWDLQYDPFNSSIMYAAMGLGGLYKSTDDGLTWNIILESAGGTGCRAIAVDKNTGDVYVTSDGDETGAFDGGGITYIKKSTDRGETWVDITQGFANVPIWALKYVDHPAGDFLLIATKGLGAWKLNLEAGSTNTNASKSNDNKLLIYPNPANDYFSIKLDGVSMRYYTFRLYDVTGKKIDEKELDNSYISYSTKNLQRGIYFVEILIDEVRLNQKLVLE